MLSYLGKLLITLSLCFQGYILLTNEVISDQFNSKLLGTLDTCDCLPDHIAGYILFYSRFVVVGILYLSDFMLIWRCASIKLLPLLALLLLLYIEHQNFTKTPCT